MAEPTVRQSAPRPGGQRGQDGSDAARRLWNLWRQGQKPKVEIFLEEVRVSELDQIVSVLLVDQSERCRLGQWVPAETYLEAFPAVRDRAECAIDLIFGEYLLREERGERPTIEEYQGRFPDHAGALELQIDLHQAIEAGEQATAIWSESSATLHGRLTALPREGSAPYPEITGYEVLGVLGRGGMGVVYRAWQSELKRPVAVKMVHAGAHAAPQVLARFRVEAEAVARLRHPNIVQIHDVGQHAGAPFLVLELVEGPSLAQLLAGTPQPGRAAAELVETLARAIHTAHQQGVVHRDLTPANILLTDDGVPKITDFGLAKLVTGGGSMRTQTGDLLGTPSYMAPEQADSRRQAIGPATDVYALGAILYEALTGRPPFKAELPIETLRQVVADEPVAPSRLRPRLPRDRETICLKCLRKEPAKRYASALAIAEDLRRFLDGRPILARRITSTEQFWRWCRRNPWLAGANVTAAALTTILALGATITAVTFRAQRDEILLSEKQQRQARTETRQQLFKALQDQARAGRFSRQVGQRFDSLEALDRATAIARELKLPRARLDPLRDEAIACLALPDLKAMGRVIPRPQGVALAAFDPTMTRYALRFRDGTVRVKNVGDDQEVAAFGARGDREIFVFRFSPDGRYLATTHFPGFGLTVWDIDRRAVAVDDPGPVSSGAARFSPDSRLIAAAHRDGAILIHDLATGHPTRRRRGPAAAMDLVFRSDGAQIAVAGTEPKNSVCLIMEVGSGRVVRSIPLPEGEGGCIAWSPDGTTLALAHQGFKVSLWDAASGVKKATLEGSSNAVVNVAFDSTGTLLASNGWEYRMRLWDAVLGRPMLSLAGTWSPTSSDISHDGRIVMSVLDELTSYQVEPALEYRTLAHVSNTTMNYQLATIRGDGRVLAAGTSQGVVLWDLARGAELAFLPIGNAWHVMFEASGDLLTGGSAGVRRWPVRVDSGRREFLIGPPARLPLPASHCGIAADRSGQIVALANRDFVYVATPERAFRVGPLDDCRYVAVSPGGEWLATGNHTRGARVWRVADATAVEDFPVENRCNVVFSPDGNWMMTTAAPCRLWAVGTWREAAHKIGGVGWCFSPDGRLLVASDPSKVLRLVETETGRTLARLESPDLSDPAWATFSPDGSRLVVTTDDRPAVHVWDLRAIRRRLAPLGLDWDAPAFSDDDPADPNLAPLPPIQVDLGALEGELEHLNEPALTLVQRYTARLKNEPSDAGAYHHRGHAFFNLRRPREAIDDFTVAIRLRPDDAHLRIARGQVHEYLNQHQLAIADFEAVLARDPREPGVRAALASCCNNRAWELATGPESTRDPEPMLKLARRAVELAPNESSYLNTLGVVQYRACRYAESVASLEQSLAAGRGQYDGYDLFFFNDRNES